MQRRDFLKAGTGIGLASLLGPDLWAQVQRDLLDPEIPERVTTSVPAKP